MWQKFKGLNTFLKVIIGIIAICFLPITLAVFSIEFLMKSIEAKNKGKIILGCFLALLTLSCARTVYLTRGLDDKNFTQVNQVSSNKNKEDAEKKAKEETKKQKEQKAQTEKQKKDEEAIKLAQEKQNSENAEKQVQAEQTKKDELVKKLETYESIYLMIPASIKETSESNNAFELQKTFSTGRDVASKCWQELGDLKDKYSTESTEYKAIQNLQLAFFVVKDACKNGIKYLDKNEYKYYEKYEKNCGEAGAWYSDFVALKGNLN
ncbi:TPA: hypothetical protein KN209_002207 [Clostridioides difficile]|uniref:hypothetical protein n=1 Tax=Clostridioides difficile TaxID=1496 RepID=UPI00038D5ADE|nr:hypothetical protein [Clostridioides difficile]EGT4571166.1 hypothetical protein [Clostridioides difficile]EGT4861519.1 hypothetical protein [Clostridioides difficile]EJA6944534.1 hypothetical protein [Clostridioides difficile]EKG0833481.1 hypothetical protein [Clostridioides difficile]EQG97872.1 hypothetical protein QKI_1749 [Clostridioides difficile DA00189]